MTDKLPGKWKCIGQEGVQELRKEHAGAFAEQMMGQAGDKSLEVEIKGNPKDGVIEFNIHGPAGLKQQTVELGKTKHFKTPFGVEIEAVTTVEAPFLISRGKAKGKDVVIKRHVDGDKLYILINFDGKEAKQIFQRC